VRTQVTAWKEDCNRHWPQSKHNCTWIDQLWNELSELQYASWPSVYQDQRDGIFLLRLLMDKVQINCVDRKLEMVQGTIQLSFLSSPIIRGDPILQHFLRDTANK